MIIWSFLKSRLGKRGRDLAYWSWSYKKKFLWNLIQVPILLAIILFIFLREKAPPFYLC